MNSKKRDNFFALIKQSTKVSFIDGKCAKVRFCLLCECKPVFSLLAQVTEVERDLPSLEIRVAAHYTILAKASPR